jgi:hypothetical protein
MKKSLAFYGNSSHFTIYSRIILFNCVRESEAIFQSSMFLHMTKKGNTHGLEKTAMLNEVSIKEAAKKIVSRNN